MDLSTFSDAFAEEKSPIKLPQIYQDQYVRVEKSSSKGDAVMHQKDNDPIPLLETIAQAEHSKLVLLGKVGSGKSSFVDYLTWAIAASWQDQVDLSINSALQMRPVVRLRLRNIATQMDEQDYQHIGLIIQKAIEREIERLIGEAMPNYFDQLLKQGVILLDGLDEVTRNDSRLFTMLDAIDTFAQKLSAQARIIITSRPYAYETHRLNDFKVMELAAMNDEQISTFIEHWYRLMPAKDVWKNGATGQAANLTAMVLNPKQAYLKPLAEIPLTLTLMTALHYARNILPHSRAELYKHSVELLLDRWQRRLQIYKNEHDEFEADEYRALNLGRGKLTDLLSAFALRIHKRQQQEHQANPDKQGQTYSDINRHEMLGMFADYLYEEKIQNCEANQLLEFLQFRSSILVATAEEHFSFVHRSFQEYLAAKDLVAYGGIDEIELLVKQDSRWWREVFLLFIGIKAEDNFNYAMRDLRQCVYEPDADSNSLSDGDWALTVLSAKAAIEVGLPDKKNRHHTFQQLNATLRAWMHQQMLLKTRPILERAEAGQCLGVLGDPRKGVGVILSGGKSLPDIDWIPIPAKGKTFMMGSDDALKYEKPAHLQTMPEDYHLSRYPVTNAQFAAFVDAGAYQNKQYWSDKAWQYIQHNKMEYPRYWHNWQWNTANHPVVGVSWFEAMAFVRWLNAVKSEQGTVRLPTEREWEFAARGEQSLIYPWKNDWQAELANIGELGLKQTSAVGLFEQPNPFAVDDMAGNVWEWTQSQWGKKVWADETKTQLAEPDFAYPYDERDGRENRDETQAFVLRGGSWFNYGRDCRSSVREWGNPEGRNDNVGFRLLLSLASDS